VLHKGKVIGRDSEGKPLRACGTHLDITDRKQIEKRMLENQTRLRSMASRLSQTEERERHRLATALHDQVGQSLVFSKLKLDQLRHSIPSGELTDALAEVSKQLEQVIDDTRTVTFDLSSPLLYELGLERAIAEWLSDEIRDKHGIKTEFEDDGQPKSLDDDICATVFRCVRELLTNIVKHAEAHKVKVSVHKVDGSIKVCVEDDGIGFDPEEARYRAARTGNFGLFSIREQLEYLGNSIDIESEPGSGTRITITVSLKDEKE
jgi:signal transduction histidine kinase